MIGSCTLRCRFRDLPLTDLHRPVPQFGTSPRNKPIPPRFQLLQDIDRRLHLMQSPLKPKPLMATTLPHKLLPDVTSIHLQARPLFRTPSTWELHLRLALHWHKHPLLLCRLLPELLMHLHPSMGATVMGWRLPVCR